MTSKSATKPASNSTAERRDRASYVWGLCVALVLTLASFALVHWHLLARGAVLGVLAVLALVQVTVHFRFFLHLGLKRKREDLQLILFSAALLIIMVTGTIWVMSNLAMRMAMP
jgi:cytochrome o ubiquinol oxidase operon protein cyoD